MSDWKWEILTEPSNGQESYSASQEQGYLLRSCSHIPVGLLALKLLLLLGWVRLGLAAAHIPHVQLVGHMLASR